MYKIKLELVGCEDTTEVSLKVTDEELLFLKKIRRLVNRKSDTICEPIIKINGRGRRKCLR
jgi:hypothetical protein